MDVKKGTTCLNLLAIMLIHTTNTTGTGYYNANVIFMMRSGDYFDLHPSSYVAKVNSNLIFYSLIASTSLSLFMG